VRLLDRGQPQELAATKNQIVEKLAFFAQHYKTWASSFLCKSASVGIEVVWTTCFQNKMVHFLKLGQLILPTTTSIF
jgi:hypothetical protein